MKKHFIFSKFLIAIVIIFSLYGCHQDNLVAPDVNKKIITNFENDEISIERAKELYEASKDLKTPNARRKEKVEAPYWEGAKKLRFKKGRKALVIPIFEMPESATFSVLDSIADKSKLTLMDVITPVQLVIYKDKDGKEIVERMYSKSDRNYRIRKNNATEDRDFTGMRWFEDEVGNFKRGFLYKDGEIDKTFYPNEFTGEAARTTSCRSITITISFVWYSTLCGPYGCYDPIYMHTDIQNITVQTCDSKHDTEYEIPGVVNTGGAWGPSDPNAPTLGDGWGLPESKIGDFLNWILNLNEQESAWVKANKTKAPAAFMNYIQATTNSKARYGCITSSGQLFNDVDGTNQNAFKHAYWSALNERSFGNEVAQTIGDNHEGDVTSNDPNVQMDVFNNQLGRKVGEHCGCSGSDLIEAVENAIKAGLGKRRLIGTDMSQSSQNLFSTSSSSSLCNDY